MYRKNKIIIPLFLLPALFIYILFRVYPIGWTVYLGFFKWSGLQPGSMKFVAFGNYIKMFTSKLFYLAFKNTFILIVCNIAIQITLGVLISVILYTRLRGHQFFRAVYFFPCVVCASAIALMFNLIYSPSFGILNVTLRNLGLDSLTRVWLGEKDIVIYATIAPVIWQYIGIVMLLSLAGLQSIPEEVLQAAEIDGAVGWKKLRYILLPLNWETIQLCIILAVTGSLKAFAHFFILTGGGPNHASEILGIHLYREAFFYFRFGYASTIATFIFVLGFLFSVVFKKYFSVTI